MQARGVGGSWDVRSSGPELSEGSVYTRSLGAQHVTRLTGGGTAPVAKAGSELKAGAPGLERDNF